MYQFMKKRVFPIVLVILLLLTVFLPAEAFAEEEHGSIAITFQHENQAIEQAPFYLYHVANWDGDEYVLTEEFAKYSVVLPDTDDDDAWSAAAATLSAYTRWDHVRTQLGSLTDKSGRVEFDGLDIGLYLVIGYAVTEGDTIYIPQPMLVSVPYTDVDGEIYYDVYTEPKYEYRSISGEKLERRVLKIWEDSDNETQRPNEVTVALLCDGEVYDEQTLNDANNWRYTWTELDPNHDWQLVEKVVPEEYTVQIVQQGVTFTVTNTCDNPPPPPPPPPPGLPQTGMLWWPVPVLFGAGTLLIIVGTILLVIVCRRNKKDA